MKPTAFAFIARRAYAKENTCRITGIISRLRIGGFSIGNVLDSKKAFSTKSVFYWARTVHYGLYF